MSTQKPLIVVIGSTGGQGGSVARFLLEDGGFRVRAVTRKVDSEKAGELAEKGAEVVYGDLNDQESINKAFEGAYGAFGVTNYWEILDVKKEAAQGKSIVDAAKKQGLKHLVWSTLKNSGELGVQHFDAKDEVNEYLKHSGIPHTSLYTAFYFENFTTFGYFRISKDSSGILTAHWPLLWSDGPIGGYSVAETGAFVLEAFKHPETWIGKDFRVQSDVFTPREFVKCISDTSGTQIEYVETTREAFNGLRDVKDTITHELWANMEWFYRSNGNPNRDMALTARVYPRRQTMRDFVEANISTLVSGL